MRGGKGKQSRGSSSCTSPAVESASQQETCPSRPREVTKCNPFQGCFAFCLINLTVPFPPSAVISKLSVVHESVLGKQNSQGC